MKESSKLKLLVKIKNTSPSSWVDGKVYADLFIKGKYAGKDFASLPGINPQEEKSVFINFDDFLNINVPDSVSYNFSIEMDKKGTKK